MSVALVVQNKTKISFFLCVNFLLFCRHKQKIFPPLGFCPGPTWGFIVPPPPNPKPQPQLYTRTLCALPSVHLNNQSMKKILFLNNQLQLLKNIDISTRKK